MTLPGKRSAAPLLFILPCMSRKRDKGGSEPMRLNAENLRIIRRVHGCTQERLADLVGCDRTYITKIERGERPLTAKMERRIREVLAIDDARMAEVFDIYLRFHTKTERSGKDGGSARKANRDPA
jgi:transcriptional regulator with XRE-family HTH domain